MYMQFWPSRACAGLWGWRDRPTVCRDLLLVCQDWQDFVSTSASQPEVLNHMFGVRLCAVPGSQFRGLPLAQAPRVHIVTDVPPTPSKYPRNNEVCCPSLGFFFMCFTHRIFSPCIISLHNVCIIIMHILCIIIMHKLCIIIVQMHNLICLHNPAGGAIFRKRTASGGRSWARIELREQ